MLYQQDALSAIPHLPHEQHNAACNHLSTNILHLQVVGDLGAEDLLHLSPGSPKK